MLKREICFNFWISWNLQFKVENAELYIHTLHFYYVTIKTQQGKLLHEGKHSKRNKQTNDEYMIDKHYVEQIQK